VGEIISIIVATRDNPETLDHCLRALARQRESNFEIVVADDGSGINTARVILDWQPRLAVPLKHAWHEDRGPRAGEIKNRAVRIAGGGYCLFLDGDCLVLPDFAATLRQQMAPGEFVVGPRLALSRQLSEQIMIDEADLADRARRRRFTARWRGDVAPARHPTGSFGCWRRDLDDIDGFECGIGDAAASDADAMRRLRQLGLRRTGAGFTMTAFELWHPLRDASASATLPDSRSALASAANVRAAHGLSEIVREVEQSWRITAATGATGAAAR